jgi:hypothetical protein
MCYIAAIFVYGVVLGVVVSSPPPGPIPDLDLLILVFAFVSLITAGLSIWWRRRVSGDPQATPVVILNVDPIETLWINCVIVWALSESVGIYGLVLGFLTHDFGIFQPFAAAALVLFYVHRPSAWPRWPASPEGA